MEEDKAPSIAEANNILKKIQENSILFFMSGQMQNICLI
jgi:hypothetical protein